MNDRLIALTRLEFEILRELLAARGAVMARLDLLRALWIGPSDNPRVVDVHVARLRQKLGPAREIVQTIRGLGYRISHVRPVAGTPGRPPHVSGTGAGTPRSS